MNIISKPRLAGHLAPGEAELHGGVGAAPPARPQPRLQPRPGRRVPPEAEDKKVPLLAHLADEEEEVVKDKEEEEEEEEMRWFHSAPT